jgi:hypothetical protein
MVSKAVIKAYAATITPAKIYRVVAEEEYDYIEETFTNVNKAVESALNLMELGMNVSINHKYFGGNTMAEHQYPVNQGYFAKKKTCKTKPKKMARMK